MKGQLALGLTLLLLLVGTMSAQVPGYVNVSYTNDGSTVIVGTGGTQTTQTTDDTQNTETQENTQADTQIQADTYQEIDTWQEKDTPAEIPAKDPAERPSITKIDNKTDKKPKEKPEPQQIPTDYIPAEPSKEKADETITGGIFELKVSDLRHAGYQGLVSDFVRELNEQTKYMRTELKEEIKQSKLEEKMAKNIGKRMQARVLEMTAQRIEISKTEIVRRISEIDEESADEVAKMPDDFQKLVYVSLEQGSEEDKAGLETQIKDIGKEFHIWRVPFEPEDFDNLEPEQIMNMITG
ncbi:hypothetical protein JW968_01270 [Candidatus Woesearchaeota archaeon]|nr:hypothetical protein [Candidatus Woesearchaeota archaeon]